MQLIEPILKNYLKLFKGEIDTLILGCTHYPILYSRIRRIVGPDVQIISQDKLIPGKLQVYLHNHPEIEKTLLKKSIYQLHVTDLTDTVLKTVNKWFGNKIQPIRVDL